MLENDFTEFTAMRNEPLTRIVAISIWLQLFDFHSLTVYAQTSNCLDSGNSPVTLSYNELGFGRFLVRANQNPASPDGCFLRAEDHSGNLVTVISGPPTPTCDSPFIFDMSSGSSRFQYNEAYTLKLLGVDGYGNIICDSVAVSLNIAQPSINSMVPQMLRLDGESISVQFSSPVSTGLCEVFLVSYKGSNLSPSPSKKGPCTSYLTFPSDNKVVAMRPGDTVSVAWSYYEDGVTVAYSTPGLTNLGPIPSSFSCSQQLALIRSQQGLSYIGITSPVPSQGKCSLVIDTCTSPGYSSTLPFTACPQYAIMSLQSLSLSTSPTVCSVYWKYEYNGVSCQDVSNIISVTIRERCIMSPGPISVDDAFTVMFMFEATNPMDCVARLLSCGSTEYNTPIEKRANNCISGVSTVTFTSADSNMISNGVACNVDFVRVPSGQSSSSLGYSCQSDSVTFLVGPPVPGWIHSAQTRLHYTTNNCVSFSFDPYTLGKVNCYDIDRFDSQSNDWITVRDCIKTLYMDDCLPNIVPSMSYRYRVRAFVADRGWTSSYLESAIFHISDFLIPSSSILTSPSFIYGTELSFSSIEFPQLIISSQDTSIFHYFVAKLVPRCKVDLASDRTVVIPLESGDVGYSGPPGTSIAPVFTYTFSPDQSSPGTYTLNTIMFANQFVPQGKYSLVLYSVQPGGLIGQYYSTPLFLGLIDTKYEGIDFQGPLESPVVGWPFAPENHYDQLSIRWTGFVEPKYAEPTVFRIESFGQFRLWVDDELVIDRFQTPCVSGVCTSNPIHLRQSPWIPQRALSERVKLFHSIRLDYMVMSDRNTAPIIPGIVLKWSSRSVPLETIPATSLFAARTISLFPNSPESFPLISVVPGPTDYSKSTIVLPTVSVNAGVSTMLFVQTRDSLGQLTDRNCFEVFVAEFHLRSNSNIVVTGQSLEAGGSLCAGLYRIPVTFTDIGDYTVVVTEYRSGTVVGGSTPVIVHVVAGRPTSVGSLLTFGPLDHVETISETRVYFSLYDQYGNELDGSDLPQPLPEINLLTQWMFDTVALNRLGGPAFTDDVERAAIPSEISDIISWDTVKGNFVGTIRFAQSGTVQVSVRIGHDETTRVTGETDVIGNPNEFGGGKSIVIPSIQPIPSSIVAGTPLTFKVQLRDTDMNVLQSFPDPLPDVFVELYETTTPRIIDSAPCTPSITTDGVYDCVSTFEVAGDVYVNITVDGFPTRLVMDQVIYPGSFIDEPFKVTVEHADLDPLQTVWSNLPGVLRKNAAHETVFTFFDHFGNDLGDDVSEFTNVQVDFVSQVGSSIVYSETKVEFREGKLRMYLVPPVASPDDPAHQDYVGYTVRLTVAGQVVSAFASTPLVRVIRGGSEADEIVCTVNPATQITAGTTISSTCVGGVSADTMNLYFGESAFPYNFVSASLGHSATIGPTTPGTYSVQSTLVQRGGLEARYFIDPDFTTVIYPSFSGIESSFTKIDSLLEFEFGRNIFVEGALAQSVEWSGYIDPPATVSVRFKLTASSGVRFSLGGAILYDSLSVVGRVDAVIDIGLTAGVLSPVTIRFRPRSTAPTLSLQWVYPDLQGPLISIPPRALLRNVIIPSSTVNSYTVVPSSISSNSRVTLAPVATRNQIFSFQIDAVDAYGNALDTQSPCLTGTTSPGCLFNVQTTPSAALVSGPVVTYVSDGTYSIDVTIGNYNPVLLHVQLALPGGSFADLVGSPSTIEVF